MNKKESLPTFNLIFDTISIPFNFLCGFIVGVAAPVVAIAAMVAGIRFLTGKVPYPGEIADEEEGGRRLSLKLVSPEKVQDLFKAQKEQFGGEVAKMRDEIQAIIEETKAEAREAALQEVEGASAEEA